MSLFFIRGKEETQVKEDRRYALRQNYTAINAYVDTQADYMIVVTSVMLI